MQKLTIFFVLSLMLTFGDINANHRDTTCPPLKLKNGRTRYRQKGRFVKFVCNLGYLIAGDKYSTCQAGSWDNAVPKCVRATCTQVKPPSNGLIYPSHRGGVLNFFCKPGYELRGPIATYCDGYFWDNRLPSCIQSNTTPSLNCSFENEDLCGWNHDIRHDFEWTRMSNKTPSGHFGTGPSYDHTKGLNGSGYYMYIEASSRNENDTARLISPIYFKMKDVCLTFFYHMYGSTTGQLKVYIKKVSQNWTLSQQQLVFSKFGNQGNAWFLSSTPLGDINEDFQIIFEGIRGASYFSDIAIDDVQLVPDCSVELATTKSYSPNYISEIYPEAYQSCLNRCGEKSYFSTSNNKLQCDCDNDCDQKNSCCPDYIAVCMIEPTDYYTGYYEQESTANPNLDISTISKTIFFTSTTQVPETKKISTISTKKTTFSSTISTRKTTLSSTRFTIKTRPSSTISTTQTTPSSTISTTQMTPSLTISTTQKVIISTPSTTKLQENNRARKTTLTIKKILINSIKTTNATNAIIIHKAKSKKVETTTQSLNTSKKEHEPTINAKENIKINSKIEAKVEKKNEDVNNNLIIILACGMCVTVLIVIFSILMRKRYKYISCRNIKRKGYGSDSQSDVRFLTSDEVLNFNLATPDDF